MDRLPSISVILAVLDEAQFIDDTLSDLLGQVYPGSLEVVVADGGSKDGTREKLAHRASQDDRLLVIENPKKGQAQGLNLAAAEASGEILVRADGHTRYSNDYVATSVKSLQELKGAVGGRMNPFGSNRFGRAVAAAMNSPLTMGPGRFHHATRIEEVDTVYLGAFPKQGFEEIGGFRSFPSGTSEDADFYYRWRRSGRKVFVNPDIDTRYTPRDSAGALWRQYWRYGQGKSEMLWANGRFPSLRPLAPMALVVALVTGLVLGLFAGWWWPLWALTLAWVILLLVVASSSEEPAHLVMLAAAIMHLAYGLGALYGLIRGSGPVPQRG